jgi:hypothetical protein
MAGEPDDLPWSGHPSSRHSLSAPARVLTVSGQPGTEHSLADFGAFAAVGLRLAEKSASSVSAAWVASWM